MSLGGPSKPNPFPPTTACVAIAGPCIVTDAEGTRLTRGAVAGGKRRHRQAGYSLIEVIVAFALLALALTLLLGTLSGATRQVRWAGDAGRAALHAQSLLDQVGVGEPLERGTRNGGFDDDRYRWTLAISPWSDPALPPAIAIDPSAARLFELDLAVQWGDGGAGEQLRLQTLRLASPGADVVLP